MMPGPIRGALVPLRTGRRGYLAAKGHGEAPALQLGSPSLDAMMAEPPTALLHGIRNGSIAARGRWWQVMALVAAAVAVLSSL